MLAHLYLIDFRIGNDLSVSRIPFPGDSSEKELKRVKETAANELEQIRVHQRAAFERELGGVRESSTASSMNAITSR